MLDKKKNSFLMSHSLKYKLKIAVCLMYILPILVCVYLVSNYILPDAGLKPDIAISIVMIIFIGIIGFLLIKEVFDRILSIVTEAKSITAGDISRKAETAYKDEVEGLDDVLSHLTQRIRNNMDELKSYGEKTAELNFQIQERVFVLSSLLQISSLISQGAKLEEVFKFTTEKSRLLADSDAAYLLFRDADREDFYVKTACGQNPQYLSQIKIGPDDIIFNQINRPDRPDRPFILDAEDAFPRDISAAFNEKFKLKNTLALPIYLRGRVMAILGIGNNKESFLYKKEDRELLDIFAKQLAIALENDILAQRIEKLEIKDSLTGLYNATFIRNRLREEIKRAIAYQRPCAFMLLDIDNFLRFHQNFGSLQAEAALKRIAVLIRDSVSEIDRVARTGDDEFAIVLPEKNKRKAKEIAEDIRRKVEFGFGHEDTNRRLTISAGVSENPLDGVEPEELVAKAKELLKSAKAQGKNRIAG